MPRLHPVALRRELRTMGALLQHQAPGMGSIYRLAQLVCRSGELLNSSVRRAV